MITKKEVKHIAELARLGLTEEEIEKMQEEFSSILGYFEKLKEVNIKGIEPTSHSILVENVTREDQARERAPKTVESIMKLAPEKERNYIKVKAILKKYN